MDLSDWPGWLGREEQIGQAEHKPNPTCTAHFLECKYSSGSSPILPLSANTTRLQLDMRDFIETVRQCDRCFHFQTKIHNQILFPPPWGSSRCQWDRGAGRHSRPCAPGRWCWSPRCCSAGRTRTVWRPGVTGRGGREGRSHHSRTTGRDCIEDIDWIRTWQGNWLKSFSALLERTVLRPIGENVLRPIAENSSPQRAENSSPPYWRERSPPYCREFPSNPRFWCEWVLWGET